MKYAPIINISIFSDKPYCINCVDKEILNTTFIDINNVINNNNGYSTFSPSVYTKNIIMKEFILHINKDCLYDMNEIIEKYIINEINDKFIDKVSIKKYLMLIYRYVFYVKNIVILN